jgi:hypothetical protein
MRKTTISELEGRRVNIRMFNLPIVISSAAGSSANAEHPAEPKNLLSARIDKDLVSVTVFRKAG